MELGRLNFDMGGRCNDEASLLWRALNLQNYILLSKKKLGKREQVW